MNSSEFNVLLYSDGSNQAFSAAVYTATLLKQIPNMRLTILQVQESNEGPMETEYSWVELRPKYKRYHWGCSTGTDYSWIDSWPVSPKSDGMKGVSNVSELDTKNQYDKILAKTNEIFSKRMHNIKHQVLCSNIDSSETRDVSDTVDTILEYVMKNSIDLIIMGTRGLSSLKGVIYGSLAYSMINKSSVPVLLVKKLPQDFIDRFCTAVDEDQFNVLLYSDGSHQAFSAAVYTANLFRNIPNMHLTVVQVQESDEGAKETSQGWIDTWPVSPTSEWMKHVMDVSDAETRRHYHEVLTRTNEIFFKRDHKVNHHVLHATDNVSDVSNAILNYATKKLFSLIIVGTRGLSSLNGLIFGSFAHNLLNRATLPVLLIKKLPQNFIDNYLADTES